jgi:DNA-binding CsgD family transcriptional regulator
MLQMPYQSAAPPVSLRAQISPADFDRAARGDADAADDASPVPLQSWMREWLAATLDEIDYGVLLVSRDARIMHVNHAARVELDARHPLVLCGDELQARRAADAAPLRDALHSALRRGLRKLLTLGDGDEHVSLSVVPLPPQDGDRRAAAALLLGKRHVCVDLSVQWYARDHGLTPAEGRVLAALCRGRRPNDVAAEFGVAISTVRTQIGSIRLKTGADSIRSLVRTIATLPPLMSALRSMHCRQAS